MVQVFNDMELFFVFILKRDILYCETFYNSNYQPAEKK